MLRSWKSELKYLEDLDGISQLLLPQDAPAISHVSVDQECCSLRTHRAQKKSPREQWDKHKEFKKGTLSVNLNLEKG